MDTYRPEFLQCLKLLANAFAAVVEAGYPYPVLVGGAAVEFYTGGAVVSGDFDVVTEARHELEDALIRLGFVRPSGVGILLRGLIHPTLRLGVEVVSGTLFDGSSDEARVNLVALSDREFVAMVPVEDLIADRMAQFSARQGGDQEMLGQAMILYQIAKSNLENMLDEQYLDRRIRTETLGECDLRFLIENVNAADIA